MNALPQAPQLAAGAKHAGPVLYCPGCKVRAIQRLRRATQSASR